MYIFQQFRKLIFILWEDMVQNKVRNWAGIPILVFSLLVGLGCRVFSGLTNVIQSIPTPTQPGGGIIKQETLAPDPCSGLTGSLELKLLVGPSGAIGLEPYTSATIPFKVDSSEGIHQVAGNGPITYYEDILQAEWGSFSVKFEGETEISGTCFSHEDRAWLDIVLQMNGEQIVTVIIDGMEMAYPWSGTPTIQASFPLEEGAQAMGEGWLLLLHLNEFDE